MNLDHHYMLRVFGYHQQTMVSIKYILPVSIYLIILYAIYNNTSVNLRCLCGTRNLSSTKDNSIPRDSDITWERDLSREGTSMFHITLHDKIHWCHRRIGDILWYESYWYIYMNVNTQVDIPPMNGIIDHWCGLFVIRLTIWERLILALFINPWAIFGMMT